MKVSAQKVRVTALVENTARDRRVIGEHGLAWWIEIGGRKVLFDTGQGRALSANATALGIQLAEAAAIVLSHGHYDHVGGLEEALGHTGCGIWRHPASRLRKFSRQADGRMKCVSRSFVCAGGGLERSGRMVHSLAEPVEIVPGLYATGTVRRIVDFEEQAEPFFLDEEGRVPDPLDDDVSLFFGSAGGVVIVLGCAHAGVMNIMNHVAVLTGQRKIHAVVGGMHLLHADDERVERTMAGMSEFGVDLVAPNHCSGPGQTARFWEYFGERCGEFACGMNRTWEAAPLQPVI